MAARFIVIFFMLIQSYGLELDSELYQKSSYIDVVTTNNDSYIIYLPPSEESSLKILNTENINKKKRGFVNKKTPISVWIWNSNDIDIAKLKKYNITRVYLQVGIGFKEGVKKLYNADIEIYGLDGSPSFVNDITEIKADLNLIAEINRKKKMINGFQIDIEPHILKDFNINKTQYLVKFLQITDEISKLTDQNKINFSVVIPFWYDSLSVNNRPLSSQIIDISDEVVLMSYVTDPKAVVNVSSHELNYAEKVHKKIKLGIELTKIEDENHQIFSINKNIECKNNKQLNNKCLEKKESYTVRGDGISYYNSKNKVPMLLNTKINYSSFDGFVYHHIKELK